MTARLLTALKTYIRREVNARIHGSDGIRLDRYAGPAGDPGLLGPGSVTWRVHADAPGMLMGSFASLMLQSLHPLAMAGVDQHSDFRTDPIGRLNRTAAYVVATVFGSTEAAEAAIARVRKIHPYVTGTADDGRTYRADDPQLLTWVHVVEVRCFLAGYETFGAPRLSAAERDRYFGETAQLARRLGAEDIPETAAEVALYLDRMRPELRATDAALEGIHFITKYGRTRRERTAVRVLMNGAAALLPPWARASLELCRSSATVSLIDRPLAQAAGRALRWAVQPSEIVGAAYRRMGLTAPRW
jgi:uncharacterized protein (DUF2236 family)